MKPVFIALDFKNKQTAISFLEPFANVDHLAVKVGMELFYKEGPSIIYELRDLGIEVFLDLKLHDIPHTVQQAAKQISQLDVQYTTIHALGGSKMIQAARTGLDDGAKTSGHIAPKLLAVTQLTSTSKEQLNQEEQIEGKITDSVAHLANLAHNNGADGVICSALEDEFIHQQINADFICINPGIRLFNNNHDDQQRVVTPEKARQLGTYGIVVGRTITQSDDPVKTYQDIYNTINGGNN
ncbi:orotidine-5'-phosphate decarboxylase [Apilactobacillus apinorum]|uniref:orotidine-5'-phosphate decarboxylase n=1 Tax=Apilactobacillus apinorum TaxID=1218495 RepID=UPI0030E90567